MRLKSAIAMLKWVDAERASVMHAANGFRRRLICQRPRRVCDGYSRRLTNKGEAAVRGMRAPVTGTV